MNDFSHSSAEQRQIHKNNVLVAILHALYYLVKELFRIRLPVSTSKYEVDCTPIFDSMQAFYCSISVNSLAPMRTTESPCAP